VDRALEVYQSMRKDDVKGSPACYTAAVHACSQKGDLDYALAVYEDLKTDGVKADEVSKTFKANFGFSALVESFKVKWFFSLGGTQDHK
jgi:pentatricopeptide repeat protein